MYVQLLYDIMYAIMECFMLGICLTGNLTIYKTNGHVISVGWGVTKIYVYIVQYKNGFVNL